MKIEWIYLIMLVLAVTAISGCAAPSPGVTPTATPVLSTATPAPTAATAIPSAAGTATPTAAPTTASITISGFAFQPATVTIAKGGTVTWTNNDGTAHTVKFQDSESPGLSSGQTYSKTFGSTGTFSYICGIHTYMKGTVVVV